MAQNLKLSVADARDEKSVFVPDVKEGEVASADYVLNSLQIKKKPALSAKNTPADIIPDLTGMGARDAVYQLERRGVKAIVKGRGKVKSQSIYSGTAVKQGMACELYLE